MTSVSALPLALVMITGPQIVSAVFFATSVRWKANSAAYLLASAVSITAVFSVAYFVAKALKTGSPSSQSSSSGHVLNVIILVLLLFLVVRVYLGRHKAEPPGWMAKLQTASTKFAFTLGLLLLGVFPSDIVTSVTTGVHVANHGGAWTDGIPFILLTLLLLAIPSVVVLLLGARAQELLPKARDWMNANSWIISEIALVFFLYLTISSLTK